MSNTVVIGSEGKKDNRTDLKPAAGLSWYGERTVGIAGKRLAREGRNCEQQLSMKYGVATQRPKLDPFTADRGRGQQEVFEVSSMMW